MTANRDRYGELIDIEDIEQARHHDCPGLVGDPDRPAPCPICRQATRERILKQRLRDYNAPPRAGA